MTNQSTVLVLDDGELDNFYSMLTELAADVVRLQGPEIRRSVPAPRDLLITAGRRTLTGMPELIAPEGATSSPTWVCVHNQDFLPMRERLSSMGVHFLLQNALDEQSRRRFLIQLLHSGSETRGQLRLPLGSEIRYRPNTDAEATDATKTGKLIDLSVGGCRLLTEEPFDSGSPLVALLPAALGGGDELELRGTVLRNSKHEVRSGRDAYTTVLQFSGLDEATRKQLEAISRGERIGTQITPLASLPTPASSATAGPSAEASEAARTTRRAEARRGYDRPVHLLDPCPSEADSVFGCDLSLDGVRLSGCQNVEPGMEVTLALFGAPRDEPIVIAARVVRTHPNGEAALAFGEMQPMQRQALEKLLCSQPVLDALNLPDPDSGRTVVTEVRPPTPA